MLDPEPECILVPVPLRQKVAITAVPVPAPVPQHNTVCHLVSLSVKVWSARTWIVRGNCCGRGSGRPQDPVPKPAGAPGWIPDNKTLVESTVAEPFWSRAKSGQATDLDQTLKLKTAKQKISTGNYLNITYKSDKANILCFDEKKANDQNS